METFQLALHSVGEMIFCNLGKQARVSVLTTRIQHWPGSCGWYDKDERLQDRKELSTLYVHTKWFCMQKNLIGFREKKNNLD